MNNLPDWADESDPRVGGPGRAKCQECGEPLVRGVCRNCALEDEDDDKDE